MQQKALVCKKCRTNKPSILIQKDPTCQQCFLQYFEHSFKMNLRMKCEVTQKNQKLLLCGSLGQQSASLIKVTSDIVYNSGIFTKSKMFIDAEVLHIDESILYQNYQLQQFVEFVEQDCKLKLHLIKLESMFDSPDHFHQLLDAVYDKQDLIWYLKQYLILKFAYDHQILDICYALNGQRLSSLLMTNISKGRGRSWSTKHKQTIQLNIFKENFKCKILKPLRDLMHKDVLYYLHLKKVPLSFQFVQPLGKYNQILQTFIDKLQNGFSSTTFTILNTSDKINVPDNNQPICPICLEQKDIIYNKLETQTLDQSNQVHNNFLNEQIHNFKLLCFGCKRMLEKSKQGDKIYDLELFPKYIRQIANDLLQ